MPLNPSATELTTAATDAVLGLFCFAILAGLLRAGTSAIWKRNLWSWVFGLLGLASILGAVAHGLEVSETVQAILWQPLYLALGLTMALFVVGAIYDWRGAAAARRLLPWAIAIGVGFFALTQLLSDAFVVFVMYEAAAMVAALAIYILVRTTGRLPGAGMVCLGIALSIVAAMVQSSALSVRLIVPFDHNGLFHLVQVVAIAVLATGVRGGLTAKA